jgi:flagellar protein FliS
MNQALKQYRTASAHAEVEAASPHRLVQLLLQGALDKLAIAKGLMLNKQVEQKGMQINSVIAILCTLQASLNLELGGELAVNLDKMYVFCIRKLTEANHLNQPETIDLVVQLIREVKSGWDQIPDEQRNVVQD